MNGNGKKVFVGVSGGVDSSVSAALLKKQGYTVTGVFIKTWNPDFLPCSWKEERRDAMRVCAALNIPFLTLDCEKEYKEGVADYMISEYKAGRTPNPDVMCNKEVKFGIFLKKALEMGADYIATGHYAQILESRAKSGELSLYEGIDKNKDQSYFLWTLTQEQLRHVLFPVGHLTKPEVRKLARKFMLPTAAKKDSQGICFVGKVDMQDFLKKYISVKKGEVLNEKGQVIGSHNGAVFYTIGQRHGFEIKNERPDDKPYYVLRKNIKENTITVSETLSTDTAAQTRHDISSAHIKCEEKTDIYCRYRYRQAVLPCTLQRIGNQYSFVLKDGASIASGQSVVFYGEEKVGLRECLGGGIVENAL